MRCCSVKNAAPVSSDRFSRLYRVRTTRARANRHRRSIRFCNTFLCFFLVFQIYNRVGQFVCARSERVRRRSDVRQKERPSRGTRGVQNVCGGGRVEDTTKLGGLNPSKICKIYMSQTSIQKWSRNIKFVWLELLAPKLLTKLRRQWSKVERIVSARVYVYICHSTETATRRERGWRCYERF